MPRDQLPHRTAVARIGNGQFRPRGHGLPMPARKVVHHHRPVARLDERQHHVAPDIASPAAHQHRRTPRPPHPRLRAADRANAADAPAALIGTPPQRQRAHRAPHRRHAQDALLHAGLQSPEPPPRPRRQRPQRPAPRGRPSRWRPGTAPRHGHRRPPVVEAAPGELQVRCVEFLHQPPRGAVVVRRVAAQALDAGLRPRRPAPRKRRRGQAQQVPKARKILADAPHRADERERVGVHTQNPEQPIRIAVRQERGLRPQVVHGPPQIAQPDPPRPVLPPALPTERRRRLPAPARPEVAEHLGRELGELPQRAQALRPAGAPLPRHPPQVQPKRHEPLVGVSQEREREVVGIEVHGPRHVREPLRHRPAVPRRPEAVAPPAVRREPVEHARAGALRHLDVDATVAMRDHRALPLMTLLPHPGKRFPGSCSAAVPQPLAPPTRAPVACPDTTLESTAESAL